MNEDSSLILAFAHDLRQTLRAMMMQAQRLQRQDLPIDPTCKTKLEEIVAAGRKQEELIASVVEYDQAAQSGLGNDARMPLRLTIQTACMKVDAYRKARHGVIHFDPASAPEVSAPAGVAKVFEKILHNALKFHADQSEPVAAVDIAAGDAGSTMIRISDNGLGIEPEYRAVVFEPFRKLNSPSEYPGSGMGLSICRRLMESIGGSITIENHPRGNGATFLVALPASGV